MKLTPVIILFLSLCLTTLGSDENKSKADGQSTPAKESIETTDLMVSETRQPRVSVFYV